MKLEVLTKSENHKVQNEIIAQIGDLINYKNLEPGDKLPSERMLSEKLFRKKKVMKKNPLKVKVTIIISVPFTSNKSTEIRLSDVIDSAFLPLSKKSIWGRDP